MTYNVRVLVIACGITGMLFLVHNRALADYVKVPVPEIVRHLERYPTAEFAQSVDRFASEPLYYRLCLIDALVEKLTDVSMWNGYNPEEAGGQDIDSKHALALKAGRAAYVIEEVFDLEIPAIQDTTERSLLSAVQENVRRELASYSQGVMDTVDAYGIGTDIGRLRQEFGPRLAGSGENGDLTEGEHDSFRELLNRFFPIGKRLIDLEMIVGRRPFMINSETKTLETRPESAEPTGVFEYRFDSGYGGVLYYFEVKDGIIHDISRSTLE